ncbi:MAG: CHAT domain-containing protein [Deltaproteobacteria bacterium]|nr:CHAT domain-containing protein [Deltaproteobacteria bacterium]
MKGRRQILALLGASLTLLGCREAPRPAAPEPHEALIRKVEFAGCAEVRRGPTCELEGATDLVLWVDAEPDADLEVQVTSTATAPPTRTTAWAPVQGGRVAHVVVPARAQRVEVLARRRGVDRWALQLAPRPWDARVKAASDAYTDGRLDEAARLLDALPEQTLDARGRSDVARVRARLAGARGDGPEALRQRARAAEEGAEAGLVSKHVNELLSMAYVAIVMTRDLGLAWSTLQGLDAGELELVASGAVHRDHNLGILSAETGDQRGAIQHFERAARGADRLGLSATAWAVGQEEVAVFANLGMTEAAQAVLDAWRVRPDRPRDACSQALMLDQASWVAYMQRALRISSGVDPEPPAREALELWTVACPRPERAMNTLVNLALFNLQVGDTDGARAYLGQARGAGRLPVPLQLWATDLEGQLAVREGRPRTALKVYRSLEALAVAAASPDGRLRAAVGRAEALRAQRDLRGALAAFAEAERLLDTQLLTISVGPGRGRFAALREADLEGQLELLLTLPAPGEVVAALARSRARVLVGLEQQSRVAALGGEARRRWEVATARYLALRDELEALMGEGWGVAASRASAHDRQRRHVETALMDALDELARVAAVAPASEASAPAGLTIGFRPLGPGVLGFATGSGPDRVARIPLAGPLEDQAALATALFGPFEAELEAAPSVRFVTEGWLSALDLHALPWRGAPLVEGRAVRYGVGSGALGQATTATAGVVIAADPSGDLPAARDEGRTLQAFLQEQGHAPILLEGRAASRRSLLAALKTGGTFHYAGHGHYRGTDGWQSVLPLAGAGALSVGDILTLPSVPARVILSGCETAQTSALASQDLGLARAFVVRGAREVLATARPVRDEVARAITMAVHQPGAHDLAEALRRAQLDLMARDPSADWAAFRVVSP